MAMISASHLVLSYGERTVLKDFSATFATGSITAIVGANGTGKSTLLAALAGDLVPSGGDVTVNDQPIATLNRTQLSQLRSLAQQSHSYWMAYTTEEILRLAHGDISDERFDYLVEKLAITPYLQQRVTTLSGGQSQRIEIARALMRELPIIFLDEPFASQDLKSIDAIIELFKAERAAGRTIVLVAHARSEDLAWCDQIINLNAR
jgi:ABC-type cobalamin/Fe3+-siderophores transport system ATPase subunit